MNELERLIGIFTDDLIELHDVHEEEGTPHHVRNSEIMELRNKLVFDITGLGKKTEKMNF